VYLNTRKTHIFDGDFMQNIHRKSKKMTSFLSKKRDEKTYKEKIATIPEQTRRNKMYAVKVFEDFVHETYENRTIQEVIEELQLLKKTKEGELYDTALYGMLQDWINWNESRGIGNYTIKVIFSNLRKYLFHVGIRTHEQDVKEFLRFGKRSKEERYPLSREEYAQIVSGFSRNPRLQALFLTLGSSGIRVGEATNLRKKDFDTTKERIKIKITTDTKTRTARSTYISKEAQKILEPILETLEPEEYVFSRKNTKLQERSVGTSLNRLLDKIGFTEKYESNRYRKITSHSFRSYFFTKAARKHGENYAHKMIGHGGYLMQYDRMTEEEKLQMYIELEPDLVVFDQTKNEIEIRKLKQENMIVEQLRDEIEKLKENQARIDQKMIEKLQEKGVLP
jgi:integrase